ncbi:MAG: hypothetical protein KDD38_02430 [Bdellovibrionales bacterium]|nr:hypothetical protein [Bdellovibrionales bacterium]
MNKKFHNYLLCLVIAFSNLIYSQIRAEECSDQKYSSGEHKQLGDSGFLKACLKSNMMSNCAQHSLPRQNMTFSYTYGDVVALGDFFATPARAYRNNVNINISNKLFRCITKQGRIQYTQKTHPEVQYPTCTWAIALASPKYLKLASTNEDHFAWGNVVAYVKYHEMALDFAIEAHAKQDLALFNKALFYGGFADHFLTDSFAAGHVRVPRKEILTWTRNNIHYPFRHFISDALAMILHDHDGKNKAGEEIGLLVHNSRGDEWLTHSDQELNTCRPNTDISIRLPIEAVENSVTEIFEAYRSGVKPTAEFNALQYVPMPVNDLPLEEFQLTSSKSQNRKMIRKLEHSLPLPLRWILPRSVLKRMIIMLPEIRRQFGLHNAVQLEADPLLQLRVPKKYINAYTN